MSHDWLIHLPVLAALGWMAAVDLRTRRIHNVITLPLAVAGLIQAFTPYAIITPQSAFYGLALGFGISFIMFAIGGMGGGDVKLMAALGAWGGPVAIVLVIAVTAILAMFIALIQCAASGELRQLFRNSAALAVSAVNVQTLGIEHASDTARSCRVKGKPVPIAVPALLAWIGVVLLPAIWWGY